MVDLTDGGSAAMTIDHEVRAGGIRDTRLTERALRLVRDKTTEMADDVLRVPLRYYRDPEITALE
jgi:choline monooxygenase